MLVIISLPKVDGRVYLFVWRDHHHHARHESESWISATQVHPILCYCHSRASQRTEFVHHTPKITIPEHQQ